MGKYNEVLRILRTGLVVLRHVLVGGHDIALFGAGATWARDGYREATESK